MSIWARSGALPRWNPTPPRAPPSSAWAAQRSLFPWLVLGWINADVRVQICILQHFSRSSRISSSRKQICNIFANFIKLCQNFAEVLRNLWKFSESSNVKIKFWKFGKFCKNLQTFADFFRNFAKSCRFWKMLTNALLDAKICEDFDQMLTKNW